jgi:hypothetical protein
LDLINKLISQRNVLINGINRKAEATPIGVLVGPTVHRLGRGARKDKKSRRDFCCGFAVYTCKLRER